MMKLLVCGIGKTQGILLSHNSDIILLVIQNEISETVPIYIGKTETLGRTGAFSANLKAFPRGKISNILLAGDHRIKPGISEVTQTQKSLQKLSTATFFLVNTLV